MCHYVRTCRVTKSLFSERFPSDVSLFCCVCLSFVFDAGVAPDPNQLSGMDKFMYNAILVPGLYHIIHNLAHNMHESLSHWPDFYSDLKHIERLMKNFRRERFVATCVKRTDFAESDALFEGFSASLHEKRWNDMVKFCVALKPLWETISECWNADRYNNANNYVAVARSTEPRENDGFDVAQITRIAKDPLFLVHMDLMIDFHTVLKDMTSWADSCTCHEHLRLKRGASAASKLLRRELGQWISSCPMRGKRLPEMVAGKFMKVLQKMSRRRFVEWQASSRPKLSVEQWNKCLHDYEQGRSFIVAAVKVKLAFVDTLPWILAGLAHHSVDEARRLGKLAQQRWDDLPEQARERQHIVARTLFRPGVLRDQFIQFSNGVIALEDAPALELFVAKLRFMCTCECIMEADHKEVKQKCRSPRCGPVLVSLANRLPVLLQMLQERPIAFRQLVDAFEEVRPLASIPRLFPCWAKHPLISELTRGDYHSKWHKRLVKVVYRIDLQHQFSDLSKQQKYHKQQADKEKAFENKMVESAAPIGLDRLYSQALAEHIKERASVEGIMVGIAPGFQDILSQSDLDAFLKHAGPLQRQVDNLEDDVEPAPSSDLFFKVVSADLHRARRPPTACCASQRLRQEDIIISSHECLSRSSDAPVLRIQPGGFADSGLTVLHNIVSAADVGALQEGLIGWRRTSEVMLYIDGFAADSEDLRCWGGYRQAMPLLCNNTSPRRPLPLGRARVRQVCVA